MNALLFTLYAVSHCAGFAGFSLMIALHAYDTESRGRMLAYNLFLVSFFLYLLPSNAAFFARAFMESGAVTGEYWYYVADAFRTSLIMTAGSYFFWSLPTETGSRRTLVVLLAASSLPIAGLVSHAVLSGFLGLDEGAKNALKTILMRSHVFLIAGLLVWAAAYFTRRRDYAVDDECREMMNLTLVGNLVFIPLFTGISFVNFGPDRPGLPFCAENLYYLVIHAANIVVLALRIYLPADAAAERTGRAVPGNRRLPVGRTGAPAEPFPEAALSALLVLTECERGIVELMARGLANKEIAADLAVTEHAVRNHIYRLFRKFGVRNRVELADLFRQLTAQGDQPRG